MKVLVTGGAGFIGSHVVDELLHRGHAVKVVDNLSTGRLENLSHCRERIDFFEADLGKSGPWQSVVRDVDVVVHLAALADIVPSIQNPSAYYSANVNGTFNLLEACSKVKLFKFVYAASSSCYGIPDIYPTPETAQIRPEYPYALTKRLGEELVMHWDRVYGMPAISLRFFNVYGPRSRTSGSYGAVFGVFLAQKLANKPFTVVGDGTQTRDFTFVKDVARAVVDAAISNRRGEIYNVGSGNSVSVNKIVSLLGGESVFIPKRPGEPDCTFADISKIRNELGWNPMVQIEDGVSEMLENIDYWRHAPVWDPGSIAEQTKDWFRYLSKK